MESAHHSIFRPDCNSSADVPSFTLRTALSAIPFVSGMCGVDVQWFQDNFLARRARFQQIVSVNDCWFPRRLQALHQVLPSLLGRFWFARVWLYPLCCQVLYYGISMIVPRFTFFTKKFVICSDQVTKIFRSGHDCVSASSARCHCYFGLQAYFTIWVLRKVCIYTRIRFHLCSRLHWMFMRWLGNFLTSLLWVSPRLCWSTFTNQILTIPVANQAIHAIYFFVLLLISHFYFCFRFLWIHEAGLPEALHSYFHFFLVLDFSAYLFTSSTESCDEDDGEVGEGVVEEELADKPRTTKGT